MNWRITAESIVYKEAIKATETIEEPPIGFAKPSDYQKTAEVLIKQNNTVIQLLVRVSEKLEDLAEYLHQLRLQKGKLQVGDNFEAALEDIRKGLEGLSIGKSEGKKQKKKGPFYVFKDPQQIFAEEKKRVI